MKTFRNQNEDDVYDEAFKLNKHEQRKLTVAFWRDMILATIVGVGFAWILSQWWV